MTEDDSYNNDIKLMRAMMTRPCQQSDDKIYNMDDYYATIK